MMPVSTLGQAGRHALLYRSHAGRPPADGLISATGGQMSGRDSSEPYFEIGPITAGTHDASGGSIVPMDEYPKYEIAEGVIFCPVFADNLSLNFVTFPAESGFPTHTHPEEQVSIVREGEIEITIGEVTKVAKPGDVIIFPPDVPHAGRTFDG